jgi:hypothetical protein
VGGSGTERAEPRRFAQAMQVVVGDSKASAQAEAAAIVIGVTA